MKIAVFSELHNGGALRAAEALTQELKKNNQVVVFRTKRNSLPSRGILSRIKHDFLDLVLLVHEHWKLARLIDSQNFDCVLVHPSRWTQSPFLLSFLKTKSIYYCQEPLRIIYDPVLSKLKNLPPLNMFYERANRLWRKWIDKINVSRASVILVNSKYSLQQVKKAYGRSSSVCYLGVDPLLFKPMKVRKIYDVLFFGTPVDIEGYDLFEKAMKIDNSNWRTRTLARKLNGKGVSDTELVKIINQSRIVVCLARNEPFGLTVLEAFACGVPVIAVSEGGYKESVIHNKTGLLVPRDPKKLALALNKLLGSDKTLDSMSQAAKSQIKAGWTWKQSGIRLEQELKKALIN